MATREQCEDALRRRVRSRDDVVAFRNDSGGTYQESNTWDDKTFVEKNITHIADLAQRRGNLDRLGLKLGILTDAEHDRRFKVRTARRFWFSVAVSILALLISMVALCRE